MKKQENTEKLAGLILKIIKGFAIYLVIAVIAIICLIVYALFFK